MIPGRDWHLYAGPGPPVDSIAHGQHYPVLRRRLVAAGCDKDARAPETLRLELLDHDAVEERPQLVAHAGKGREGGNTTNLDGANYGSLPLQT